jgi:hypothetical protein
MVEFNQTGDFVENHTIPEFYHYSDFNKMWGDDSGLYLTGYTHTPQGNTSLVLLRYGSEDNPNRRIPGYSIIFIVGILGITTLILTSQLRRKFRSG